MAEITDEQLAVFTKGMQLLTELSTKPETRRDFERAVKKLRPDIETTEDLAESYAAPVREELKIATGKIDAFLAAQEEAAKNRETADADRARDDAFGRLKAGGYTEEGISTIQKLMVDRRIADPEAAAALFDKLNPPQEQHTGGSWEPNSYGIKDNAVERDVKGLFSDSDRWADTEVYNVLKEMRSGGNS